MKLLEKIKLSEVSVRQLRLENPAFNALIECRNRFCSDYQPRCIKVQTADNLVLELYRDKHNNYIYREYEKN